MKKLTIEEFQNRLNKVHPKEKLQAISYDGGRVMCKVKCLTCGQIYEKMGEYYLDKRKVSICKNCFPTHQNTLKTDFVPPEDYELVGQYTGMHNKVLTKHITCGFIWEITPNNLKLGKGCPKCNKKISKGEQRIKKFLDVNNIKYIHQYPLKTENNCHLTVDFYLPDYDLYIEYDGEQHFYPISHFGGEEKFIKQQENDNIKNQILKDKLLRIAYTDFENIEEILLGSTTIPKGSTL